MTAIHEQDLDQYPDIFQLGEQMHRPTEAPETVRRAWTEYLGVQATAELGFVRTMDTLRELVAELERTAAATARRTQEIAYARYATAVTIALEAGTAVSERPDAHRTAELEVDD